MTGREPPWLTAIYTVVGFLIIAALATLAYAVAASWKLFLAIFVAWLGYRWYRSSAWVREQKARHRIAGLLRRLAALECDFPSANDFSASIVDRLQLRRPKTPHASILAGIRNATQELYASEGFTLAAIPEPPPILDSIEGARYEELLTRQYRKLADPQAYEAFRNTLVDCLAGFIRALPDAALVSNAQPLDGPTTLTVPLIDMLEHVGQQVENAILPFYAEPVRSHGLFTGLRDQLDRNLHDASGVRFPPSHKDSQKVVMPSEYGESDVAYAYLNRTPLEALFGAQVPFTIAEHIRFEHTHILAGSGHGKTQTLQHLLLADLMPEDHPSLVIIDSQGDMLRKISHLALFDPDGGRLASKLVIIDPSDVEYPPALNMFDVNFERLGQYGPAASEQILNGVIELYDYIFGSLLGAELTQKQSVIFRYLARLMLTIPGATIRTLIDLMNDATPFMQNIEQLPPGARLFFETEFPHKSFADTKRQIQRRMWGILENPTFERMLTAQQNRIDMFDALNSGKIVLVNTAKDFLKAERSSFLGRLFIALTLQAALERAALPEGSRRPAFLYIDEAADYFDSNIDDLLTQARKYNLGVVFSHQYLDQLAPGLRSSIAANTSIKLAGGVSDRDARSMAPDMRTTPTFLLQQRKRKHDTQFACYLRNITPHALSLSVPFGALEAQATMTTSAYARLRYDNRRRVGVSETVIFDTTAASSPSKADASHHPTVPRISLSTSSVDDDWDG